MGEYWEKKIKDVVDISKEYGFSILDDEFWGVQPAAVLSLIVDVYTKQTDYKRMLKLYHDSK